MRTPSMEKLFSHLESRRVQCKRKAEDLIQQAVAARADPEAHRRLRDKQSWHAGMEFAFGEVITYLRLECMDVHELLLHLDEKATEVESRAGGSNPSVL